MFKVYRDGEVFVAEFPTFTGAMKWLALKAESYNQTTIHWFPANKGRLIFLDTPEGKFHVE